MAIIKNAIPILEYDYNKRAVLMPAHEALELCLPPKAVFAFLGEDVDSYARKIHAGKVSEFVSATKNYPIYVCQYKGEDICLCQAPVGAAAATQLLDWLIGYGVKKVISTGSCGTLADLPENKFLIPIRALRDEGTSYHYLPAARFVELNRNMIFSIERLMEQMNIAIQECVTWTTDGFFRETEEMVEYRKAEGCEVVEMECAALAACAEFREIDFGMLLFTADSLSNLQCYDERSWGADAWDKALSLCFDVIHSM